MINHHYLFINTINVNMNLLYVKIKTKSINCVLDTSKTFIQNIAKLIKEKCTIADQIRWSNINGYDKQINV